MDIQTTLLKGASLTMTAGSLAFKGTKYVCSQGHNVANGLRKTADALDYISTVGERKSQNAIDYCLYAKEDYERKILEITKNAVDTLKNKGVEVTDDMIKNIVKQASEQCAKTETLKEEGNEINQTNKDNLKKENNTEEESKAEKVTSEKTNPFAAFTAAIASNI